MSTLRGIWILPINSTIHVIMTSNYVIVSIKVWPEVVNVEYIILCKFVGRIFQQFLEAASDYRQVVGSRKARSEQFKLHGNYFRGWIGERLLLLKVRDGGGGHYVHGFISEQKSSQKHNLSQPIYTSYVPIIGNDSVLSETVIFQHSGRKYHTSLYLNWLAHCKDWVACEFRTRISSPHVACFRLQGSGDNPNGYEKMRELPHQSWGRLSPSLRGTQRKFLENICSENDLRFRILGNTC